MNMQPHLVNSKQPPSTLRQLIESLLELLPYPDTMNGQTRNVEDDDSWYNEFKCAIYEKHPQCTLQAFGIGFLLQ